MKQIVSLVSCVALSLATMLATGCDWSSGGDSSEFNTSQQAGVAVNWSGVYNGNKSGGSVVGAATSVGTVTRLVLNQAGNSVDIVDNNGLRYSGNIGAPGAVANPTDGVLPANSEIAASQITFSGNGVDFVGVLHAIAVTDIQGNTTSDSSTDTRTSNDDTTTTLTEVDTDANTTTTTTITQQGDTTVEIVSVTDNQTGVEISRTINTVDTGTDTQTRNVTTTYNIQEANSQIRLEGTWIDSAGSFGVDAISRGAQGSVSSGELVTAPQDGGVTVL